MTESFAELFEESLTQTNMRPGSLLMATVVDVRDDLVIVNAGLKSEGVIPASQFTDDNGELDVNVGDTV
ncbi:MAG: 30S ribosomal protein S1, partial [Proteobacteria bacterium SW_6_67_9]